MKKVFTCKTHGITLTIESDEHGFQTRTFSTPKGSLGRRGVPNCILMTRNITGPVTQGFCVIEGGEVS